MTHSYALTKPSVINEGALPRLYTLLAQVWSAKNTSTQTILRKKKNKY